MAIDVLKRCALFLILVLAQALVFGRIQLFGCAMPLLYVYFVITYRPGYPRWATLLWGFALGVVIDMFANTPGVAMFSLTLLAALQPYLLGLFLTGEAEDVLETSVVRMGWGKFTAYAAIMTALYCVVFFTVESFSFFNWLHWLLCIVGSTILTLILVMTLESVRK